MKLFALKIASGVHHCYYFDNLRQLAGQRQECDVCFQLYERSHNCPDVCFDCKGPSEQCRKSTRSEKYCLECRRVFTSNNCFRRHKSSDVCSRIKACVECGKTVKQAERKEHNCGLTKCNNCGELVVLEDHDCFIQPIDLANMATPVNYRIVCFDVEAYMGDGGRHVAYCVTALLSCQLCFTQQNLELECDLCGNRKRVFYETADCVNVMLHFTKWLFFAEETKNAVVFSYNGSGYDQYFVLRCLLDMDRIPTVTANGGRIIELKMNGESAFFPAVRLTNTT